MLRSALILILFFGVITAMAQTASKPEVIVLGVVQDGGYPHPGCFKKCCQQAPLNDSAKQFVVSLAVVDPATHKWWLFEATPDMKDQLAYFRKLTAGAYNYLPDGIFITHAHIGHYTGLMILGREVMNTKNVPVYCLPRMKSFLEKNGPWSQLVSLQNIALRSMTEDSMVQLSPSISVEPVVVPHRDEFSETAGFHIVAGGKTYLFIPDINKWQKWDRSIRKMVDSVDIALVDGTFDDAGELSAKSMAEVPHPLISETMRLFENADARTKAKIHFIHFNHTNPVLWDSQYQNRIRASGFNIATQGASL